MNKDLKIAFLHTSKSHIKRFNEIINEIDHKIEIHHHVDEGLLESALKDQRIDVEGFKTELRKLKSIGIDHIICTCSTYGEICDENENVYRIDRPIAEYIISNFTRIGIAYTVQATIDGSKKLIEKLAFKTGKSVKLFEINCEHCWDYFKQRDMQEYEYEIAETIKNYTNKCEIVFLAQASMEGAKKYLVGVDYKVVSSPKYGVEKFLKSWNKNV